MQRSILVLALALLAPAAAGCLAGAGGDVSSAGDAGAAPAAEWPPLESATVRPGVQVRSDRGQCTSNFVFVDNADASLYLGLAAHCVDTLELGAPLDIANGAATGTLYYDSWRTMDRTTEYAVATAGGTYSCDNAASESACAFNDFALVRIDDAYRDVVHPAVRHFGGPVALADSADVPLQSKVVTYGNSGLRQQQDPVNPHEGYVTAKPDAWYTRVHTVTPGVPGDSGSALLTGDGKALGVLVTLAPDGANGAVNLDVALAYAKEHAGVDVRLATWDVLDAGLLPELPS